MRPHSTHDQLVKAPEVLAGFFSKTQSEEKAEIKWPVEPWIADPEQVMLFATLLESSKARNMGPHSLLREK